MGDDGTDIVQSAGQLVRCAGRAEAPHVPVQLALVRDRVVACPVCGRQFRRVGMPDDIGPAVWPREQ